MFSTSQSKLEKNRHEGRTSCSTYLPACILHLALLLLFLFAYNFMLWLGCCHVFGFFNGLNDHFRRNVGTQREVFAPPELRNDHCSTGIFVGTQFHGERQTTKGVVYLHGSIAWQQY